MAMGLGELGLSPSSFYELTIDELNAAVYGAQRVQERLAQHDYEVARLQAFWLMQPHVKKGWLRRPTQLSTFMWEREGVEMTEPTRDELLKVHEEMKSEQPKVLRFLERTKRYRKRG